MSKFWSYISNGQYSVGCTGQTVWLYDNNGAVLSKFNDLPYAYLPVFSPDGKRLVVKSSEGRMAVYSLGDRKLIKKFRYSKVDAAQDNNCCFSPDSKRLYNIEQYPEVGMTRLSVYNTEDFTVKTRISDIDQKIILNYIEYDQLTDRYYLLGYERNNQLIADHFFVTFLNGENLADKRYIPEKEWWFLLGFKALQGMGFTEKAYHWSYFGSKRLAPGGKMMTLEALKEAAFRLADYYPTE